MRAHPSRSAKGGHPQVLEWETLEEGPKSTALSRLRTSKSDCATEAQREEEPKTQAHTPCLGHPAFGRDDNLGWVQGRGRRCDILS